MALFSTFLRKPVELTVEQQDQLEAQVEKLRSEAAAGADSLAKAEESLKAAESKATEQAAKIAELEKALAEAKGELESSKADIEKEKSESGRLSKELIEVKKGIPEQVAKTLAAQGLDPDNVPAQNGSAKDDDKTEGEPADMSSLSVAEQMKAFNLATSRANSSAAYNPLQSKN